VRFAREIGANLVVLALRKIPSRKSRRQSRPQLAAGSSMRSRFLSNGRRSARFFRPVPHRDSPRVAAPANRGRRAGLSTLQ